MKVYGYRTNTTTQQQELVEIFDIHEVTYSGKDMGERKIDATIKYQTPIDFQIGDYIELQMADLRDSNFYEKFYIKTLPTVKKTSSSGSAGDAFEHSVTFYPSQFDLTTIQMRDLVQETNVQNMLYTGYDEFSFMAGAHTLMRRIMYVLNKRYGNDGVTKGLIGGRTDETAAQQSGEWEYMIAEAVDEDINTGLEKFQLDFSQNTVWDALTKLTDEAGINTTFFINNRVIYVGFTRPHIKQITSGDLLDTSIFNFEYGKSSHLKDVPNSTYKQKGGLYDITKSVGQESPITRLYAYGAQKNLSRFYCADRLTSGRYIPQLMLPSFMNDGVTDYIESTKGIQKFGVREGSKRWDDIYPTLQHVDYKTLRDVKYVFKIENSGLNGTTGQVTSRTATIRCYKVVSSSITGVNKLQPSWPPVPVAIFVHATGKTVKCVMYTNAADQKSNDHNVVPVNSGGTQITGACFCVHKLEFSNYSKTGIGYNDNNVNVDPQDTQHHKCENRSVWFTNMDDSTQTAGLTNYQKKEIGLHQIQYTDDYWGNDVFEMGIDSNNQFMYDTQTVFVRNNMSFGCWPRIESNYQYGQNGDNVLLNEVAYVQPITTEDTDYSKDLIKPKHFYIYLRDYGFKINEQAYSGQYNWLIDGAFHVSFLDGYMGGLEFEITDDDPANIVCAYNDDGTINSAWLDNVSDSDLDATIAQLAKENGAVWRLKCIRNTSNEYSIMPNKALNPTAGDHIAFLDIRMPDVYILAAQNRLLTKAQKYLNDNDNGSISYAVSIDKVRMAQQPKLGLQMREGAIMRIKDSDLDIYTDNEEQTIYKSIGGAMGRFTESPQASGDFYGKWNNFVQIRGGKHYVIEVELTQHHKLYVTEGGQQVSNPALVRLFTGLNANTSIGVEDINVISVIQNYSDTHKTNITKNDLVKLEFDAPDNLSDESNFVLAFQFAYTSASTQEYVNVLSVVESNTATQGESAQYVDLTIDQLTIKLSDTVREYNPNSTRRAGNGGSSTGQTNKDISATVRERQRASAWGTLINNIEEVAIESSQNSQSIEHNADVARYNFSKFEKLRDAIFDPDGTINEVFFRTMMLQVGADSMNYTLDRTYIANGTKQNISLVKDNGIWKLNIGYDTLRHYAVISGTQGGTWRINKSSEFQLDYDKIYYIALKCSTNGTTGDWIVETEQPTVDKYNGYKVFNYGIVVSCDANDNTRFISETRGNVYVYGDNVVLGRIATQDGTSYLDLMRKTFKLGNDLTFENGQLTIKGTARIGDTNKTASQIITELGLAEYLTNGIQNGSTEVAGGLILAQALMLKNDAGNAIQAGMSGKANDPLLWGGANYAQALYAAMHDYIKSAGGSKITTLLKKDGTGKIGCFEIGEDTVYVYGQNGENIIITQKSIAETINVQHEISMIGTKIISLTPEAGFGDEKYYNFQEILGYKVLNASQVITTKGKYRLTYNPVTIEMHCDATGAEEEYVHESAQSHYELNNVYLLVVNNGTLLHSIRLGNVDAYEEAESEDNQTDTKEQTVTIGSSGTIDLDVTNGTLQLYLVADDAELYIKYQQLSNAHASFDIEASFNILGIEKYSVFAKDGIGIIIDANNQFYIYNDSSSLKVIAEGLPVGKSGLVQDQMYLNRKTEDGSTNYYLMVNK